MNNNSCPQNRPRSVWKYSTKCVLERTILFRLVCPVQDCDNRIFRNLVAIWPTHLNMIVPRFSKNLVCIIRELSSSRSPHDFVYYHVRFFCHSFSFTFQANYFPFLFWQIQSNQANMTSFELIQIQLFCAPKWSCIRLINHVKVEYCPTVRVAIMHRVYQNKLRMTPSGEPIDLQGFLIALLHHHTEFDQ